MDDDESDAAADPCALSWTVYSVPGATRREVSISARPSTHCARRSVRRPTRWALCTPERRARTSRTRADSSNKSLESGRRHRIPDHAPTRALRVLENAAHIDAIITVSSGLIPIGLNSSAEVQMASEALRPLSGVVRSARLAAVSAILHSAWRTAALSQSGVHTTPLSEKPCSGGASGPDTRPAVAARCAVRRGDRRPPREVGVRRGRAGERDARALRLQPQFVVEIPHHLDVVGDKADRADDHRLGAASARAVR